MSKNVDTIRVFLSDVSEEMKSTQDFLSKILVRAGMEIIFLNANYEEIDDEILTNRILDEVKKADCTIHILGHSYGKIIQNKKQTSLSEFQFYVAQNYQKENVISKIFIWYPQDLIDKPLDASQEDFINSVRNNISSNMVYSNHESPVVFVEDLRSIMLSDKKEIKDIKDTDIFFIYNELDEDEAHEIIELVSDIADVTKLGIVQSSPDDYMTFIANQMTKTKLLVIYFNRTSDWATHFVQQVWNKTGGASSQTPILFLGDLETETNENKNIAIPNVNSMMLSAELMPLEIKVHLDAIKN
jgi:hypothetical protein